MMRTGLRFLGVALIGFLGLVAVLAQDPPTNPPTGTPPPGTPGLPDPNQNKPVPPENPGDGKMKDDKPGTGAPKGGGAVPGRGIKPPLGGMEGGNPPTSPGASSPIPFGQPPSEVGGKLLREWVQELRNTDPSSREQAVRAVASFGPNAREAIPALVERLQDRDSSPRMRAVLALRYLDYYDKDVPKVIDGLAKRVAEDTQASIRYEAVVALGRFGHRDGKAALPAVLKASEDQNNWEIRRASYMVLPRLGTDELGGGVDSRVYKALINGAKDTASMARHEAIIALAFLGKPNDATLAVQMEKTLQTMILSRDAITEIWSRIAMIGFNGQTMSQNLPAILKRLKDPNFLVRMAAVRAVGMLGPPAREAVPELAGLLQDRNPEMILSSCIALASMGSEGARAAEPLRQFLARNDLPPDLRQAASMALDSVTRRTGMINPPAAQPNPR